MGWWRRKRAWKIRSLTWVSTPALISFPVPSAPGTRNVSSVNWACGRAWTRSGTMMMMRRSTGTMTRVLMIMIRCNWGSWIITSPSWWSTCCCSSSSNLLGIATSYSPDIRLHEPCELIRVAVEAGWNRYRAPPRTSYESARRSRSKQLGVIKRSAVRVRENWISFVDLSEDVIKPLLFTPGCSHIRMVTKRLLAVCHSNLLRRCVLCNPKKLIVRQAGSRNWRTRWWRRWWGLGGFGWRRFRWTSWWWRRKVWRTSSRLLGAVKCLELRTCIAATRPRELFTVKWAWSLQRLLIRDAAAAVIRAWGVTEDRGGAAGGLGCMGTARRETRWRCRRQPGLSRDRANSWGNI